MTAIRDLGGVRPRCVCCGKPYGRRYRNWPIAKMEADPWDGKTIITKYEPFCTLGCALIYARAAYRRKVRS